ncbi:hypothetical protein CLOM_g3835 [Closterium sp. NIES-68]|nr:hypothetical protein CLOM_g3835 [Closterium sp. NIES-68]GJP68148.1 hypothetical protein CLOP_g24888 [Closterium sp. NIES-67]
MSSADISGRIVMCDQDISPAVPTDASTSGLGSRQTAVPASSHEQVSPSQSLEGSDPPSSISFEANAPVNQVSSHLSHGLALQLRDDPTDHRWSQDNATCVSTANDEVISPHNEDGRGGDGKPHEVRSVSMNDSLMQQMEDLISMVPRLQLERSRSEMEIIMKRKHVLGSFLGTPKSGKSPQIVLPRTRSF